MSVLACVYGLQNPVGGVSANTYMLGAGNPVVKLGALIAVYAKNPVVNNFSI